jgi:hypothetical protein
MVDEPGILRGSSVLRQGASTLARARSSSLVWSDLVATWRKGKSMCLPRKASGVIFDPAAVGAHERTGLSPQKEAMTKRRLEMSLQEEVDAAVELTPWHDRGS